MTRPQQIAFADCRLLDEPQEALVHVANGRVHLSFPDDPQWSGLQTLEHADIRFPGTILRPLTDWHVHLGLVDRTEIARSQLGAVLDLGWTASAAREWSRTSGNEGLEVAVAGQFLTAPGGYPSTREWAAPGAVREIENQADAVAAVDEQRALGARVIKVTVNADAGPVPNDDLLHALAAAAPADRRNGVLLVVHVEGVGEVARVLGAIPLQIFVLAHTPWTERLPDELIGELARRTIWISTLDIHGWGEDGEDYARARDNLTRFVAAGGAVLYGTDMGNGPLPVGLNTREVRGLVRAGMSSDAILRAMRPDLLSSTFNVSAPNTVAVAPTPVPADPAELVAWFDTVVKVAADDLVDYVS